MTVNYTTNLALGQPVTGTESGTWGDDVNNAVTSYLDIAIAGGLAITITTTDVTLTLTQGTSSATNISSTTAQHAILNVSGAMTAARNLIVPSSSRSYVVNNTTTGGFLLTVKGSATTGVTLVNNEKAIVSWNGTDYVKISSSVVSNLTGTLPVANGGTGVTTSTGTGNTVLSTSPSLTTPTFTSYRETVNPSVTVSAATHNIDLSLANVFYFVLAANVTFTFTNPPAANFSKPATIILEQDATGSRLATFTGARYTDGTAPILSTGANQIDVLTFFSINGGSFYFGTFAMANVS